jgi:hypothetical protein
MPGVVEKVFVNGKIKYEEKELIKWSKQEYWKNK